MFEIIIASLACFRFTYLLTEEEGPWDIFERMRVKTEHVPFVPLQCFYCTSVWTAFAIGVSIGMDIISVLAISGLAILFYIIHEALQALMYYAMQLHKN